MTRFLVLSPANDLLQSQLLVLASASSHFLMCLAVMRLEPTWLKLLNVFLSTFPVPSIVPNRQPANIQRQFIDCINE